MKYKSLFGIVILVTLSSTMGCGCLFEDDPLQKTDLGVGDEGYNILNPDNHPKLWVEVDWTSRKVPKFTNEDNNEPLDIFIDALEKNSPRCYIEVLKENDILGGVENRTTYTVENIKEIEAKYRSIRTTVEVQALYILFLGGRLSSDSPTKQTLGMAYTSNSIAIFLDVIEDIDLDSLPQSLGIENHDDIKNAVLLHELGHLLGLDDHMDSDGVMHRSINTNGFIDNLTGVYPQYFGTKSIGELKDTCIGLSNTTASRIRNGSSFDMAIEARFNSERETLNPVYIEYWTESEEKKTIPMIKKGDYYWVNISPKTQQKTIYYRIHTTTILGRNLYSSQKTAIPELAVISNNNTQGTENGDDNTLNYVILFVLALCTILAMIWSTRRRVEKK